MEGIFVSSVVVVSVVLVDVVAVVVVSVVEVVAVVVGSSFEYGLLGLLGPYGFLTGSPSGA